jgi:PTS system mannose-specific IIA component
MCFNVEVLSGVNLPMILSAVYSSRSNISVSDLAEKVLYEGQKSIVNIKKVLSNKMNENG